MYSEASDRQNPPVRINNLQRCCRKGFSNVAQLGLRLPGLFPATNGWASRHHSVFSPSNHLRRSAMLYAFPSFAAGSSLACKAFRICLSLVPMRMAASLTVTAMRSSNGDLDDTVPPFLHRTVESTACSTVPDRSASPGRLRRQPISFAKTDS